jgi:hypothetical protein
LRLGGPEAQYRDAQVRAPGDGLEAAWLAVPGHFPNSREWAVRAYTQLTRLFLRRGDAERLRALASSIDGWDRAQTHEQELADIARAGAAVLRGDIEGALSDFDRRDPRKLTDPALIPQADRPRADRALPGGRRQGGGGRRAAGDDLASGAGPRPARPDRVGPDRQADPERDAAPDRRAPPGLTLPTSTVTASRTEPKLTEINRAGPIRTESVRDVLPRSVLAWRS